MKNLFILFLSIGILFTSCSKDLTEEVVGTYFLKSTLVTDCGSGSEITIEADENGCITAVTGESTCTQMIINTGGTATIEVRYNGRIQTSELTYTLDEGTNTLTLCGNGDCSDLTYDDGQLTQVERVQDCDFTFIYE